MKSRKFGGDELIVARPTARASETYREGLYALEIGAFIPIF